MSADNPDLEMVEYEIHEAAREGRLTDYLAESPAGAEVLYRIVADLVYERLTRRLERTRGHYRCASSADDLLPECHDGHQDDVEAMLADLLKHADQRIDHLRAWMTPRLTAVTVDAHRRRRGERGALQRPRLPGWLRTALGGGDWLCTLAVDMLTWVGVPIAAPGGLWPLGAWAERRGAAGIVGVTESQVAADVERVLTAMRTKPAWHEMYVERPLGFKQAPLVSTPHSGGDSEREPDYVSGAGPDETSEATLRELASGVIDAVETRLLAGDDPRTAVVEVLAHVFGGGTGSEQLGDVPGGGPDPDERVAVLLADSEAVDRVVDVLVALIDEATGDAGAPAADPGATED